MQSAEILRNKPIILCFVASYLPGYRSGGPIRTIANFVDHFGDEFDIRIVTMDRDGADSEPYSDIQIDSWSLVGKAQVFYASKKTLTLRGIARLLRETCHDLLYLNSFFNFSFTSLPLLARRFGLAPRKTCVIAPRGEFSAGAIALKSWKKRSYLHVAKLLRLYSCLQWQASSSFEAKDIRREFGQMRTKVVVAPNLPTLMQSSNIKAPTFTRKDSGPLQIIFLSRISQMKNLDYLINVLNAVTSKVFLNIFGPIEDVNYWNKCQKLIEVMPDNIIVKYRGELKTNLVNEAFLGADLFVLPTRGENFGHVVLESLIAGTPVLISDRTPWQASGDMAVTTLPLENPRAWEEAIECWCVMSIIERKIMRSSALAYARRYLDTSVAVTQNRGLFLDALQS